MKEDVGAPTYSDEDLALRFADKHANDLRYVAKTGRWFCWDGKRWCEDVRLRSYNRVRKSCRAAARECNEPGRSRTITSGKTIAAVEKLARADQRLAAVIEQWDADPWLLNTPDGIVDLRTGDMRGHDPNVHMTKMTAVGPDASCPIPRWESFLARVTEGDDELEGYLKRVFGYCLTGETVEHAMFFFYGLGANGKSVLLETVQAIMADYAQSSPIETFTLSKLDRHPTELARMHGARLVTATETEGGKHWAESRIKQLTGGDTVTGRFMRQDFFDYTPQFKLVIRGNHKPGLHAVDEAIKRRLNIIPFKAIIPPDQRDKNLTRKLKREWPGILAWMIDGCREWQKHKDGLGCPEAVRKETDDYFEQEDRFKRVDRGKGRARSGCLGPALGIVYVVVELGASSQRTMWDPTRIF